MALAEHLTDEQKRRVELDRANKAKALLESEMLKEILDTLERDTIDLWEQTPSRDNEAREKLWMFYVVTRKFRNTLLKAIETGKMAEIQLAEKRGLKQVLSRFGR